MSGRGSRRAAAQLVRWGVGALCASCLAVALAGFLGLAVGPHVFGYRTTTMLSGSMRPHLPPGSVLVDVPEPLSDVRVGQVLTFHTPTPTGYVDSHRVIEVVRRNGETFIRTQGDANGSPDPWVAQLQGATVWRVHTVVPWIGYLITGLRTSWVHVLLLWAGLPLVLALGLRDIWRPRPVPADTERYRPGHAVGRASGAVR